MNWLDKTISFFSPQTGLRRDWARMQQRLLLNYEAARSGRRQGGWRPNGTSGNAEIGPSLSKVRDNAEDLVRNNAFASKSRRRWTRRLIGYGITPQADTGDDKINAIIDRWWSRWVPMCCSDRRLNFYACQSMIARTAFVRGECLIRLWDRPLSDGLPVPFQIQVLEPDYLDTSKTQQQASGYIIHGVQFDSVGRIQGFWLFGSHPGDLIQTSARGLTSKFVPADSVLHHAALDRPGDVRAISRYAPVIAKLRDLDEVGDAKLMKTKAEACIAMFVAQPEGPNGPTLGPVTDADGNKIEQLGPGMIAYGQQGQEPQFLTPTGSGDYPQYKKSELKEISAGMDQPYVVLGDDLESVNYSSFRGGAVDERDAIDEYRWLWFVPQVNEPIWRKFIDTLVMMGEIPESNYGVKWNPPPFDLLDRAQEAEADRVELQIGKSSWPQLAGNQGLDPRRHLAEITEYRPLLEQAGITFAKSTSESSTDGGNANAATR